MKQVTEGTSGEGSIKYFSSFRQKSIYCGAAKRLDLGERTGRMGTVLGVFYRHRHTSSKTSSFGGTSAQPLGVALFFALSMRRCSMIAEIIHGCGTFHESKLRLPRIGLKRRQHTADDRVRCVIPRYGSVGLHLPPVSRLAPFEQAERPKCFDILDKDNIQQPYSRSRFALGARVMCRVHRRFTLTLYAAFAKPAFCAIAGLLTAVKAGVAAAVIDLASLRNRGAFFNERISSGPEK